MITFESLKVTKECLELSANVPDGTYRTERKKKELSIEDIFEEANWGFGPVDIKAFERKK